ncbi:divergent polysaccharide deacetylase family protein [Kiloniella antarctica]|uniref:Divergent polysaccharide deacetylase family protein n=1 Tax=Kiloniella antarctica TaxID=1550907 RepID=A0ABW5BKQ0_9PROT
MNWNKIVLIISWVALISVIGAAAGYTIYGPPAPLPYIYTEDTLTTDPHPETEGNLPDANLQTETTHTDGNEHTPNSASEDQSPIQPEEHTGEKAPDTHADDKATEHTEAPEVSGNDQITGEETPPITEETAAHPQPEPHSSEEVMAHTSGQDAPSSSEHEEVAAITDPLNSENKTSGENETTGDKDQTPAPEHTSKSTELPATSEVSSLPQETSVTAPSTHDNSPINDNALSNIPSWKRYAQKPPVADGRPKIAIVLTGLGLSRAATEAAIRQLPPTITLSFTPYARDLESWIALARSHHHEVLLDLPMEPLTYPSDDPGPQALLTGRQPEGNINNLAWIANRGSGFVGMSAYMGDRFVTSERQMIPVIKYFKDHGLLFLDNGKNQASLAPSLGAEYGVPVVTNQRAIDEAQLSRLAIDSRLAQVEQIALKNGFAIATGRPYPVTLERIATWVHDLENKGFQLVPITAVASVPKNPTETSDKQVKASTASAHAPEKSDENTSDH